MNLTFNSKAKTYEELPAELITSDVGTTTSAISLYLKEISKYPVLTPNEEQELARRISNGDMQAKEHFINSNLRLVVSIAKAYQTDKFELLDLIQEGNLGLLKAVDMFDYTKGFKFSTYATWWIRRSILKSLANKRESIKIPVRIQELINKYKIIQNNFYTVNRRYATDIEVSKKMNVSEDEVKKIRSYIYNTISLNTPISVEDDVELGDFIEDEKSNTEILLINNFNKEMIDTLIASSNLNAIEEKVIRLRYDLEKDTVNSLEVVAKAIGKTRESTNKIERKILQKLRAIAIRKFGLDSFFE